MTAQAVLQRLCWNISLRTVGPCFQWQNPGGFLYSCSLPTEAGLPAGTWARPMACKSAENIKVLRQFSGDSDTRGPETSSWPFARVGTPEGLVIINGAWFRPLTGKGIAGTVTTSCKVLLVQSQFNSWLLLLFHFLLVICGLLDRDLFPHRIDGFDLTLFFLIKALLSRLVLHELPHTCQEAHQRN